MVADGKWFRDCLLGEAVCVKQYLRLPSRRSQGHLTNGEERRWSVTLEDTVPSFLSPGLRGSRSYVVYYWNGRRTLILPRICGGVKAKDRLFQKEDQDHAKGAKDLHTRMEARSSAAGSEQWEAGTFPLM